VVALRIAAERRVIVAQGIDALVGIACERRRSLSLLKTSYARGWAALRPVDCRCSAGSCPATSGQGSAGSGLRGSRLRLRRRGLQRLLLSAAAGESWKLVCVSADTAEYLLCLQRAEISNSASKPMALWSDIGHSPVKLFRLSIESMQTVGPAIRYVHAHNIGPVPDADGTQ